MFDFNLIKIRIVSFAWSLLSLAGTALLAMFLSTDFAALVAQHFGEGATSTLILLAITEVVKHLRNLRVIAGAHRLGGAAARAQVTLI